MISILLPTRNRPDNLRRLIKSIQETADDKKDIEMVVYIDNDDKSYDQESWGDVGGPRVQTVKGERIILSKMWNVCYEKAQGPIYMHCGDDIIFRTPGWDTVVKETFDNQGDKILFVHGDDGGGNGKNFGTHGFLHKNWVDVVGYFVPPYYVSDYNDTHLNEVANLISRRIYVDILTEHMHPAFGKAEYDITHNERLERHRNTGVDELYAKNGYQRTDDANKLRSFIDNFGR